jgi:hypothetical protein
VCCMRTNASPCCSCPEHGGHGWRGDNAARDSQIASLQAVVDSLAAELHLQVHSVFTSWPQCTEPGCREAGATLDQAQPPRQQEVPD